MPGNARPGQPEGKRHREQTAHSLNSWVRVKRWGKSPPRGWQQPRHGKPHREQCQIGIARGLGPGAALAPAGPGWQLEASGNGRPRGMVAGGLGPSQNPAYRPSARCLFGCSVKMCACGAQVCSMRGAAPQTPRGIWGPKKGESASPARSSVSAIIKDVSGIDTCASSHILRTGSSRGPIRRADRSGSRCRRDR